MTLRRDAALLALINATLDAILAATGSADLGSAGADLNSAVGDLRARVADLLRPPCSLFAPLAACFDLARRAGMAIDTLEGLRVAVLALPASDLRTGFIRTRCAAFCCLQESRAIANTTFVSRNEIDRVLALVTAAFEAAQVDAAASGDAIGYRALVSLRAATVRDLTSRARPLPRVVPYTFQRTRSSLTLAQRLYGDASRAAELIAENEALNPLFMPRVGTALSV